MSERNRICLKTRKEWRRWLELNHEKSSGVWLVFYRKHSGKQTLSYDEAVEEALCFGWIDSLVKKIDGERYARKITPRKSKSRWSNSNKKRVSQLEKQHLMTPAGMRLVREAKASGRWDQPDRIEMPDEIPRILKNALAKNEKAKAFFERLAPSYQKHYIAWIVTAKRDETKKRRVRETIALLEQNRKLGMK